MYALILWRGIKIAKNTDDNFGAFLATGITAAIGIQVCINMGVTLGILPTKGLTLPFLSYGGTSLLVNMASIGILMNIGKAGGGGQGSGFRISDIGHRSTKFKLGVRRRKA